MVLSISHGKLFISSVLNSLQSPLTFCQWLLILPHFAAGCDFVRHSFLVISTQDGSGSCPTAAIYWPLLASTCSPFKAQPCWPDRYKLPLSARLREKKIYVWEFTGLQMAIRGGSKTGMVKPAGHESRGNFISSCLLLQLGNKNSWWAFVHLSVHLCNWKWTTLFEEHWLSSDGFDLDK